MHITKLVCHREKLLFFLGILAHKVPVIRRVVSKYTRSCRTDFTVHCFIFTHESSYCFQRILAIAILSVRLSVCLSVCLSHGWISQK